MTGPASKSRRDSSDSSSTERQPKRRNSSESSTASAKSQPKRRESDSTEPDPEVKKSGGGSKTMEILKNLVSSLEPEAAQKLLARANHLETKDEKLSLKQVFAN